MTSYAYMIPASESGRDVLEAIAEHPTSRLPDHFPIWARWDATDGFRIDWKLLAELRGMGITPVVYAETGDMPVRPFLDGAFDQDFQLLAARSRGADIRVFHEANGSGLFAWQSWSVGECGDAFGRAGRLFQGEGAGLIYCVSARGRTRDDMLDRFPGADVVRRVAFDSFTRSESKALPPKAWSYPIESLGKTGLPVDVCETGILANLERRRLWMRSLPLVQGVSRIAIFDFLIVFPKPDGTILTDDWRWNAWMAEEWNTL